MSELDKLSALINLVQQQNLQMIHQWDILSDYLSNQLIIPTRLKDSVVQSICDLTETESKLQKAIKALNSEWAVNSFADAENALAHLNEEKNYRELAEKINQLVVTDSRFADMLRSFANSVRETLSFENADEELVQAAKALLDDVQNGTCVSFNSLDGIVEKPYGGLLFPLVQGLIVLRSDITSNDEKVLSDNGITETNEVSSSETLADESVENEVMDTSGESKDQLECKAQGMGEESKLFPEKDNASDSADFDLDYSECIDKTKVKNFSITAAMSELCAKRGSRYLKNPFYADIIYAIGFLGSFTVSLLELYLEKLEGNQPENYELKISKMVKNNILAAINISNFGECLYFLTAGGKKLFGNAKFRDVYFRKDTALRSGNNFEENSYDIAASITYQKLIEDYVSIVDSTRISCYTSNLVGTRMLGLEGRDDKLYFISVFLTCDEETIERSMHIIADTDDPSLISIKCLVISSFNREACEDIFERIKNVVGERICPKYVLGFPYDEQVYYNMADKQEITLDSLKCLIHEEEEVKPEKNSDIDTFLIEDEEFETVECSEAEKVNIIKEETPDSATIVSEEKTPGANDSLFSEQTETENKQGVEVTLVVENDNVDSEKEKEETTVESEQIQPGKIGFFHIASYESAVDQILEMLISDAPANALAYLKVLGSGNKQIRNLYLLFAYAYDDPMLSKNYSSDNILAMMDSIDFDDYLIQTLLYAATARTFFYNDIKFDYNMLTLENSLSDIGLPELRLFIRECIDYKQRYKLGIDALCDYRRKDQLEIRKSIIEVSQKAKTHYDSNVLQPYRETAHHKRGYNTVKLIFDKNSDLAEFLNVVASDDKELLEETRDYISGYIKGDEVDENKLNTEQIEAFIDDAYDQCSDDSISYRSTKLLGKLRNNLLKKVEKSFFYIAKWVRLHDNYGIANRELDANKKKALLESLRIISEECKPENAPNRDKREMAGRSVINNLCCNLTARLDGSFNNTLHNRFFYVDFLKTGDIMLKNDNSDVYVPDLTDYCYGVTGFKLTDRIVRNYTICRNGFSGVFSDLDYDSKEYCDIGAMNIVLEYLLATGMENSEEYIQLAEIKRTKEEYFNNCVRTYRNSHDEFVGRLELKKSYGAFDANSDDDIKETLLRQSESVYTYANDSRNFGFYERAINFIDAQVKKDSEMQAEKINGSLRELLNDPVLIEKLETDSIVKTAIDRIRRYIDEHNFTAAEDLMNRVNNNDLTDQDLDELNKDLLDFLTCYQEHYLNSNDVSKSLKSARRTIDLVDRYSRARKDTKFGKDLCEAWISSDPDSVKVKNLLRCLGLDCTVRKFSDSAYPYHPCFDCTICSGNAIKNRYEHVIAPFGSLAHENYERPQSFRVVYLFGKYDDERLFTEIDKLANFGKNTIIFVDYAFNEPFRRRLSQKIKNSKYGEIFLVIDRVMFLYLATHGQRDNIIGKLMNIAMPFSYYQPYVADSMSKMPPEMFFGRTGELQEIEDRNGIHFLYGGRQLGKSALLKRAKMDIDNKPNEQAVFIDIKGKNVTETAECISYFLSSENVGILERESNYTDWMQLCRAIMEGIRKKRINYFLLLLDEGDCFIDDCANYKYKPIEELKHIMDAENFKFVVAGLHNLARYNHSATVRDNSVLAHLRHLTIKPFAYSEAKKLLEVPLGQLGMFIEDDAIVSTILATANYFPGLIQLYCSKLVKSLRDIDNSIYPVDKVPPYVINEKHIQKILANREFTEEIKKKFEITLELDKDDYYRIIALLLAEMYHSGEEIGFCVGYTANEVYERGTAYGVEKISNMTPELLTGYMEELVELNILKRHPDDSYTFLRQNFLQLMGTSDEILDKLDKYTIV